MKNIWIFFTTAFKQRESGTNREVFFVGPKVIAQSSKKTIIDSCG